MDEYRSGHNEAVLKTVGPKGHEGSNPSSSANMVVVVEMADLFYLTSIKLQKRGVLLTALMI